MYRTGSLSKIQKSRIYWSPSQQNGKLNDTQVLIISTLPYTHDYNWTQVGKHITTYVGHKATIKLHNLYITDWIALKEII